VTRQVSLALWLLLLSSPLARAACPAEALPAARALVEAQCDCAAGYPYLLLRACIARAAHRAARAGAIRGRARPPSRSAPHTRPVAALASSPAAPPTRAATRAAPSGRARSPATSKGVAAQRASARMRAAATPARPRAARRRTARSSRTSLRPPGARRRAIRAVASGWAFRLIPPTKLECNALHGSRELDLVDPGRKALEDLLQLESARFAPRQKCTRCRTRSARSARGRTRKANGSGKTASSRFAEG